MEYKSIEFDSKNAGRESKLGSSGIHHAHPSHKEIKKRSKKFVIKPIVLDEYNFNKEKPDQKEAVQNSRTSKGGRSMDPTRRNTDLIRKKSIPANYDQIKQFNTSKVTRKELKDHISMKNPNY